MSKNIKAELAKNAKVIQAAAKKAAKKTPPTNGNIDNDTLTKFEPSTRDIKDILAERTKMSEGNTGVIVSADTPIEEHIPLLDYFFAMGEHVGFFIGDVILAGQANHGTKFEAALAITGRSLSTLKGYVTTARAVPIEMRQPLLSFSTHREVARLKSPEKKIKILSDAAEKAKDGKTPTAKEIRNSVVKAEPPKVSRPKAPKASKSKPKKDAPKAHEYTPEEQAKFDEIKTALEPIDEYLGSKAGKEWQTTTTKIENKIKRKMSAVLGHISRFANLLEKTTGY